MKKNIIHPAILILMLLAAASCYYDSEEALYPSLPSSCDTTNVTFSATIAPIMASNCLSCHSNSTAASAGGNIRLQDYADVKAQNARITGAVKQLSGFSPMPKNGGRLSDCSIRQFDTWVQNGMPGN